MPFALIGSVSGVGTTAALNTTGADLIVLVAGDNASLAVSDSKGNTYTALTVQTVPGSAGVNTTRIFYCRGATVGAGHTATVTPSFGAISMMAFSGANLTPFDVESGAQALSVASIQPGSVTPTAAGSLLIAGCCPTGGLPSIDSGFTIAANLADTPGVSYGVMSAYLIQGTSAAVNPTISSATTGAKSVVLAVFKPTPPGLVTATTLTGPGVGAVGSASTTFTIDSTPAGGSVTGTQTLTPTSTVAGDTFTPASVSWTGTASARTFTLTPISAGLRQIGVSNTAGYTAPATIGFYGTTLGQPVTNWAGYKIITVTSPGAVTGYQHCVQFTRDDIDFTTWQSDARDVLIATATGTVLPHWRRQWDASAKLAELWFKCDLAAGANTFRLYYGNPSATDASSLDAVFGKLPVDGSTLALYHFDEGSGTPVDATGNTTMTLVNAPTWVAGELPCWGHKEATRLSSGAHVNMGATGHVKLPGLLDTMSSAWSVEFTFRWPTTRPTGDVVLFQKSTAAGQDATLIFQGSGADKKLLLRINNVFRCYSVTGASAGFITNFVAGRAYRIVAQQSSTLGAELWINGTLEARDATATTLPVSGSLGPFTLGAAFNGTTTSNYSTAEFDELRVLDRFQPRNEIIANWQLRKYWAGEVVAANRLTRIANPIIDIGTTGAWDDILAQEPAPYLSGGNWTIFYTGGRVLNATGMGRVTGTSLTSLTKTGAGAVLGGPTNGSGYSVNTVHQGAVSLVGGTMTIFLSLGASGLGRTTSTDGGVTWTTPTLAVPIAQVAGATDAVANPFIFQVGGTGTYHLFAETYMGGRWVKFRLTNSSLSNDGNWVVQNGGAPLTSLNWSDTANFSYSHMNMRQVGNIVHCVMHSSVGPNDGSSVTRHAKAHINNLDQWLIDAQGHDVLAFGYDGTVRGYRPDQIADPCLVEDATTTYLLYDVSNNDGGTTAFTKAATFTGTTAQLFAAMPSSTVSDPPILLTGANCVQNNTCTGGSFAPAGATLLTGANCVQNNTCTGGSFAPAGAALLTGANCTQANTCVGGAFGVVSAPTVPGSRLLPSVGLRANGKLFPLIAAAGKLPALALTESGELVMMIGAAGKPPAVALRASGELIPLI